MAILPCSQLTYVEAVMTQRKEDFIHACEAALLFYEGTILLWMKFVHLKIQDADYTYPD